MVDEDDGIREFKTCEEAVSAADDTEGLVPNERHVLLAADDDDGVL